MTHTPMPGHLDHLLQKLVKEASEPSPSAANTVFVFCDVLAQAYAIGHKDGRLQVSNQQWLLEDLQTAYNARKTRDAAAHDDNQDNFGG
jgi:hypothetical protein